MKHLRTLLAAVLTAGCCAPAVMAQTMKVYRGQVITAIPAATAADITFSDGGTTFSVQGTTFSVADVDQIIVDRTTVKDNHISISYGAEGAFVTVPLANLPHLSISAEGGKVSIVADAGVTEELTYSLSGSSDNGSFTMDGELKSTVELNNLTLTNPNGAAIDIANGKRINIVVPEGTTSTLTDGAGGTHKACFFVNGHAELQGGGTLNLTGRTRHAFASDEYTLLKPSFGTLNITAAESDGIHVEQYFQMDGGTVTVNGVKGDGIDVGVTKDVTDEFNGQAFINGGKLTLHVAADDTKALKTDNELTVTGGTIHADVKGDGCKGFSVGTNLLINQASGQPTVITMNVSGTTYMKGDPLLESKCRGIKVKGDMTFDGGNISMNVTGAKAKGLSVDGTYNYISGTTNVIPE